LKVGVGSEKYRFESFISRCIAKPFQWIEKIIAYFV